MTLVAIPWQTQMLVHPDFLAKLAAASKRLGRDIYFGSAKSPTGEWLAAWRSRAATVYLWNGWVRRLPGFSSASNPDSGPRSHQRGVGGDLASWSADIDAALRWAGIQVNGVPGEPWHIQLPNFASYPIINENTTTAGSNATRLEDEPAPKPKPKPKPHSRRNKDMDITFKLVDGANKFGKGENATFTFIGAGGTYWLETTGMPSANPISVYIGGYGPEGGNISPINLTYAELVKYAEACHASDADLARYRAAAQ